MFKLQVAIKSYLEKVWILVSCGSQIVLSWKLIIYALKILLLKDFYALWYLYQLWHESVTIQSRAEQGSASLVFFRISTKNH